MKNIKKVETLETKTTEISDFRFKPRRGGIFVARKVTPFPSPVGATP